ncbi:MAG: response regulator [bacterium]|nr:response regulator [bacterium]
MDDRRTTNNNSTLRILAVDDSPTMREIIVNALNRAGYSNVIAAPSGREALALLETEPVGLIISDWNMPEMDGLTLVSAIRNSDSINSLPILIITTRSVSSDIVEVLKAGANNYIAKPFTPDGLKEKIEQVLAAL